MFKSGRAAKGQAMAEFVLIAPIFTLLLVGILQFTYISLDYIKVGMLERELMMYCSTTGSTSGIPAFAKDYAKAIGMDDTRLTVDKASAEKFEDMLGWFGAVLKFIGFTYVVDVLYGNDITISYKSKLTAPFRIISGNDYVVLKTTLHSGVGVVFNMDLDPIDILETIIKDVMKAVRWLTDCIVDFFKHLFK